ncbi:MAG: type II secretion system F family protein [Candidatus Omnitrophota bacterium]
MSKYIYSCKDREGKVINDLLEAKSRYEAIAALQEKELTVVSISQDKNTSRTEAGSIEKKKRILSQHRIRLTEFSIFCRQLSVCIASGINLLEALNVIAEDMDNPYFKSIIFEVISDINNGMSFTDSLAKHKGAFNPLFIALIKSAEESGSMRTVLEYLAAYIEKAVRLQRKVRSITSYPAFIGLFFIIMIFVVTIFILPRFEKLFSGFGAQLPQLTQVIFRINSLFIRNLPVLAVILTGGIFGIMFYNRYPSGRYKIDGIKLRIPAIGPLIKKTSLARFCRIFALMIRGGVPIVGALATASEVCNNKVLEKYLDYAKQQIVNGSDIASSIGKDGHFPKLMVRMIGIGESSGRLHLMLDNVSEMYEDEVEGSIMVMTSLFEPVMIIVFGGIVLVLLLAIYVPVFKIAMSMRA